MAHKVTSTSGILKTETTSAPDVDFIRDLILQLRTYDNVDAGRIILLVGSNGAALVNRLLIELNGALFQEAITLAGHMNESQFHDGAFWSDPTGGNAYDTVTEPAKGRRILSIAGTDDQAVPYLGGPGVVGYNFLPAGESTYYWARQMGYGGLQSLRPTASLSTPRSIGTAISMERSLCANWSAPNTASNPSPLMRTDACAASLRIS